MAIKLPYDFVNPPGGDAMVPSTAALAANFAVIAAAITNPPTVVFVDTSAGPSTYDLPSDLGPDNLGTAVLVKDKPGHARINKIMVATTDGSLIDGQAFFVIEQNFGANTFVWNGDGWSVT